MIKMKKVKDKLDGKLESGTLLGSDHANVWGQIYNAN
jgi:hypothetical protein